MGIHEDDKYLTIFLVSYDKSRSGKESFYFLEMSTRQALLHFPQEMEIVCKEVVAYNMQEWYLKPEELRDVHTIRDFLFFFENHPDLYIQNCRIDTKDISLTSHDDGEVSLTFSKGYNYMPLIKSLVMRHDLDPKLITRMMEKNGHYFSLDKDGKIIKAYKNFDEYIEDRVK